jgi:uncharacterized protein (DUF1778 family)
MKMHFPEKIYQRIAEASAISGLSIEEFISDVVEREANRVLEDGKFWNMSAEAAVNIQHLMIEPPLINAAAKKADRDLLTHVRIRS